MTGLLATENISILKHILIYILISNRSLLILHADLITCFIESEIGHDRCNNRMICQASLLHQILSAYIHNTVTIYNISIFIYSDTSVCISIIGKSYIQLLLLYKCLKYFDVGRSAVRIDIHTIWFIINNISLRSKCIKDTLCDTGRTSIRTVKSYLHIFKRACSKGNQVSDITVSSCCIVNSTSNIFFCRQRYFPNFAINISLNFFFYLCLHLMSGTVDRLDTIIIIRVMAGGNHKPTIKVFCSYHVRHTRCCRNMKKICICS